MGHVDENSKDSPVIPIPDEWDLRQALYHWTTGRERNALVMLFHIYHLSIRPLMMLLEYLCKIQWPDAQERSNEIKHIIDSFH